MKKLVFLLILVLSTYNLCAQTWVQMGTGLSDIGRVFYADSISNKLFVGGNFSYVNGRFQKEIAAWDGTGWDTLFSGIGDGYINTILRFQNSIYVGGAFTYLHSSPYHEMVNGFTRLDGNSWDSLNTGFHNSGAPNQYYEYYNMLYCVGEFDSAGNCYSPNIVTWDGANFAPVLLPNNIGFTNSVDAVVAFQNQLYFAGSFILNGTTYFTLLKWDGINWNAADTNFNGYVTTMVVYNGELYIAGSGLYNVPGNYIVKYDGTNFSAVGAGVNFTVFNLRVFGNKLYVVGGFDSAGAVAASGIAVWDGNNWSAFSNDTFNSGILDVAVFNNEIYVTGGFSFINSDTIKHIARYNGWYLGMDEPTNIKHIFNIYPNPTHEMVTLIFNSYDDEVVTIKMMDGAGRVVLQDTRAGSRGENQIQENIAGYSKGFYILELQRGDAVMQKKIIIE